MARTARMTAAAYRKLGQRQTPETELQRRVADLARAHGLMHYHTHDSRRSEAGFPDSVIVGPGGVAFLELKTARGRLRPAQRAWIDALTEAGQDARVIRPADLADLVALMRQLATPLETGSQTPCESATTAAAAAGEEHA